MKKLLLSVIFTLSLLSNSIAQTSSSELQTINEQLNAELTKKSEIITNQKEQISKLESELDYYKETLDLMNSKIIVKQDDFVLKINSVIGQSSTGTIRIEGVVENKGPQRTFRSYRSKTLLYDPKGNIYKAYKVKFGDLDHLQEFQKK